MRSERSDIPIYLRPGAAREHHLEPRLKGSTDASVALSAHLARLADGDREAFDAVYRVAWPRVRALCGRLLDDHPDADDVAQQALIRVFERASAYDPEIGPALPWILGVAAWSVRSHRKRGVRRREVGVPEGLVANDDPEGALVRADLERAVREVMGALDARDQEVLELAMTDRPTGATFRKRLQRAMARLRAELGRVHGG